MSTFQPKDKVELKRALHKVRLSGDFGVMATWDTSRVTDMSSLFERLESMPNAFFAGITNWDTSNVTNFSQCFLGCMYFDQPVLVVGGWDTKNAHTLELMFKHCKAFNNGGENIVANLASARSVAAMFYWCTNLNVPIVLQNAGYVSTCLLLSGCTSFNSQFQFQSLQPYRMSTAVFMLDNTALLIDKKNEEIRFMLKSRLGDGCLFERSVTIGVQTRNFFRMLNAALRRRDTRTFQEDEIEYGFD